MNIIELIIDEEAELYGVDALSLVEQPAIESEWVAMKSQEFTFKTQDEEKRIVWSYTSKTAIKPMLPLSMNTLLTACTSWRVGL